MRIHLAIPPDKPFDVVGVGINVVDTTGAGDVFHGAFLYGLLQSWEAGDILLFANAVSALKCTRLSGRAGIPRVAEVRTFLGARGQGRFLDPS
jgi:sulfofructose kinase